MSGRLIALVPAMLFVLLTRISSAVDFSEQQRCFEAEVNRSLECLVQVCQAAWPYDNLRPAVFRAKWTQATLFNPAEPVIHLSVGSPRYREIVGQMAYWDTRCCLGRKCLFDASHLSVKDEVKSEILSLGGALVEASANYRKACAWAWPYVNLRPFVKQPGVEPATILNPLLPVATAQLSPLGPDYKEIRMQLNYWEAEVCRCEKNLKDCFEKNNIPLPKAGGQKPAAPKPAPGG
jgi:hypothetical protein